MKTKTHLGKRVLSVVLSVLMVVTMLPTFAFTSPVTASAANANSHLVGAYFTRNATDGVDTNSNVTWDNATNSAYFNGDNSYVQLTGRPMAGVNSNTGFTIAFDVRLDAGAINYWGRILDFNNGVDANADQNASAYFFVTSAWGDDRLKSEVMLPGTTTASGFQPKPSFTENEFHKVVISYSNGTLSYYLDGNTVAVSTTDLRATQIDVFSAFTNYYLGKSSYSADPYFKGYLRNVYLFDAPLNYTQVQSEVNTSATLSELESAISAYETKMNTTRNGAVYTNMGVAYQQYVLANRALDVYKYGRDTSVNLGLYADMLNHATNQMSAWSAATATQTTSWAKNSSPGNRTAAENNILYAGNEQASVQRGVSVASVSGTRARLAMYYPTTVLLYTGANNDYPMFPAVVGIRRSANKGRSFYCVYPKENTSTSSGNESTKFDVYNTYAEGGGTRHLWRGNNGNKDNIDFGWDISQGSWIGGDEVNTADGYIRDPQNADESGNAKYWASAVRYIGAPSSGVDDIQIIWALLNDSEQQHYPSARSYSDVEKLIATATAHTYVVNYATITSGLSSNLSKFSTINNYKAGGALDVLYGYQIAAGLDLSSTRFSNNITDATLSLKSQIETATAKMAVASTVDPAYAANYATFKTYLETEHTSTVANVDKRYTGTPIAAYNDGVNSGFTAATYTPYVTAYEAAAAEMAKVLYGGYTRNTEIGTAKSTLETRFNALEKSITYLPTVTAGGTHLNRTDNITFNLNASDAASSRIHYTIDYDNDTDVVEQTVTDGTTLQLFNNTSTSATVTYWSVNADGAQSATQTATYHYLSAPTISVSDNAELDDYSKVRIYQSNTSNYQLKYSIDYYDFENDRWANSWSEYANPDGNNDFQPFGEGVNTTHSKVRIKVKQTNGTVSSDETTTPVTVLKTPNLPVITTDGTLLDTSHGFTIADSKNDGYDGEVTFEYSYDGTNWTPYNGKVLPYSGKSASDGKDHRTIYARAVRNGIYSGLERDYIKYLSRPVIKKGGVALAANDELLATDTLTIESTKDADGGTLKYAFSVDGGTTWSEAKIYSSAITPFNETVTIGGNSVDLSTKVNVMMKAWEEGDGSTSYELEAGPILLKKAEPLTVYYNADSEASTAVITSTDTYNNNGHFFINTDNYEGCAIYYQTKVDGGSWSGFTSYSINGGVDTDAFGTNKIVEIRFFVIENQSKTVFASGEFVHSGNYNELAFKESFDSASASGSTLTLSGDNGTATASTSSGAASDTFSVVDGAGYSDGTNSPDWRNNVLKINSNNNNTYKLALATNPLSTASTAYIAKKNGITISLWRYVPDGKFTNSAEYWTPTLSFSQPQGPNGERYYFLTTESAYVTRSDSAIDGNNDYNKYVDIKPDEQDPTQHATGNRRNRWLNVVITVDPTSGVTVYTNGEPHPTTVTAGTGGTHGNYTGNNAALAQDILDFVTNDATTLSFADGEGYWSIGNKDLYLDDIRIYTDVKTQVDINNMYIYDADVESDITSTSHDPTNVTVYTLGEGAAAVLSAAGYSGEKGTDSKVGQEFIDYYGLDATNSSQVKAIDEYSFGTGMTVYHYNKITGKWDVVGDNAGRCGYQNEKLFGAEYHTGIAVALAAATGSGSSTGAGHLVWAPHVMYNLTTDRWVYYGSTSSWGVQKSAIFMCENETNDDVTGPYTYKEITYQSTAHPNAIDACVYYGRDANGKPQKGSLNMVFGSWSAYNDSQKKAIASKQLNNDGTTTGITSYDRIIAAGMTESASSDGDSAEGAWVTYENGYYYLYVSYGQNTGSYAERVFRSTTYNDGFIDLANVPATNTENKMKGNQIIAPFDMSNYNYTFKSTGHNSIYKTVNIKGEVVTLHSTHARPNTNASHDWIAIPDNALATCQSEVDGNLNLINQVAYNSLGWPVLMPYQYDGTDTVKANVKGEDIEGVYAADDLRTYVSDTCAPQYNYTIVADDDNPDAAYEYGTDVDGDTFTDYIVLSTGADGTRYANYYANKSDYDPENPNNNLAYCGVVGKHGDQICISMICPADREHTWTYRIGNIPHSDDVDSLGDSVSMDGVIYTHASTAATNNATFTYALYGTEISDDFQYGTSDLHQGERCTTITTSYPAKIDTSNPTAIYCVSDEAIAKQGNYSGGDFKIVALNDDKWFDESGNRFTDTQAISLGGVSNIDGSKLMRRYGLKGYVSNYYYENGQYKETGVELIVSYSDVDTGRNYSEFEFCYVAANPSMAHTISGSRNEKSSGGGADLRAGLILFDRFLGSSGTATNVRSTYTYQYGWDDSNYYKKGHENGIFNYLSEWGSSASLDDNARDYKTPENMANNFHDSSELVNGRLFGSHNSGAFAQIEINREVFRDTIATATTVVDTDYYIDYSNVDNYDINNQYGTVTTSNGKPTGYKFTMRTANINWAPQQPRRWGATSYMLNNLVDVKGNKVTTNSTYDTAKGDKLPTAPYMQYSKYSDSLNDSGNGETRLYYGNVNNESMNTDSQTNESGLGRYSTNTTHYQGYEGKDKYDFQNKYLLGLGDAAIGRKVMSGYYANSTKYNELVADNDFYSKGISATGRDANGNLTFSARSDNRIEKAFDYIDSGNSATNAWNMHIDFNGKYSVPKNTDTSLPAEQYANFILEQGISAMPWWSVVGFDVRHASTNQEVYKYYNIGVHTCDKGAARSFAENYLRKKLAVTKHEDGTVTVKRNETTGAPIYLDKNGHETNDVTEAAIMNAQDYTSTSYQEYIDAVAELNYFVKNPTNTTFGDYSNSGAAADEKATEYVTAYDNNGTPYYVTNKDGANIFGDNGVTVNTDKVQAKLIEDVITAYEDLFSKEDYTKADEVYGAIELLDDGTESQTVAKIDEIRVYSDKEQGEYTDYRKANFTDDSWTAFVQLVVDVSSAFNYETGDEHKKDKDYWRNVELDGAEYRKLEDILKDADDTLLPAVNITPLSGTYATKNAVVSNGIFENGTQTKTLGSWNALKDECDTAYGMITPGEAEYARSKTATIPAADVGNKGEEERDFTYTQGQYAVTGVTRDTFDDVTFYARTIDKTTPSAAQATVNTENTTLSGMDLVAVDDAACYTTYDNANTVVSAVDMDKYTDHESENREEWGGKQIIEDALSTTKNAVYASDDDLTAYNTKFSTNLTAANKVKKTTTGETDPQSAALLSAINTVNNTHVDKDNENSDYKYIKYFDASLTVQQTNRESASYSTSNKVMYGDSVDFTIPNGMDSKPVVNWGVTTFKGVSGSVGDAITSQKLSGFQGTSITRVVTSNIAVVAEVDPESVAKDTIQYNILDCYGHLAEVKYVSNKTKITVDSNNIATAEEVKTKIGVEPKQIPFYSCTSWLVTQNSETLTTLKPLYSTEKPFNYTFIGATTEGQNGVLYDTKVQVAFDTTKGTFAAWAVRVGSGSESDPYKYQIASYSQSYAFYACANETYVAIVNTGTDEAPVYKTVDGTPITASNLDGAITETGKIGSDAFVTQKIHDKMAFVSVENVQMEGTKVRLYVRITEGATEPTGYGVLVRKDYTGTDANMVIGAQGVTRKVVTSKLSTGQFTYTINKSAGFTTGDAVSFRAFVNYDFSYTDVGTTVSINALDYSRTLKVQKS